MRALVLIAALAMMTGTALAKPPHKPAAPPAKAAAEATWIVVCFDQHAQYTQVLGGAGFFHVANDDHRTYDTQKLVQSTFDGNTLCAIPDPKAPKAASGVAEVCADRNGKMLSVLYVKETATKRVLPKNADPYCEAHVDVVQ